jgi:hypothetical protein
MAEVDPFCPDLVICIWTKLLTAEYAFRRKPCPPFYLILPLLFGAKYVTIIALLENNLAFIETRGFLFSRNLPLSCNPQNDVSYIGIEQFAIVF